jgi:hypothetical protein
MQTARVAISRAETPSLAALVGHGGRDRTGTDATRS